MDPTSGTGVKDKIYSALSTIMDPDLGKDIVTLGFVKDLLLKKQLLGGYDVTLTLELTTPACPIRDLFKKDAENAIKAIPEVREVRINMTASVKSGGSGSGKRIRGVKNVIAVGSGKGGVGKSTLAVNLAYALKSFGSLVGLLDADIHGPSLGMMLGLQGMPMVEKSQIQPVLANGVPVMSFSFFAPVGDAVIWRGAMTGKAVEQMLFDVNWAMKGTDSLPNPELDYLIVDMPPGTGDIALTLIHSVDLAGAVVISTPQDVSLLDAAKGIAMFQKLKVPVLGLVENMSGFVCSHCHQVTQVFEPGAEGGVEGYARKKGLSFLGKIPLDPAVSVSGDSGTPFFLSHPDHPFSLAVASFAQNVAHQLSILQRVQHA